MSVKIYEAYRVKPSIARDTMMFWRWVRDMHEKGEGAVKKRLRTIYAGLMGGAHLRDPEAYEAELRRTEGDEYKTRLNLVDRMCREEYGKSVGSSQRSMFDFDVNLVVRELDGQLFIIPYQDMQMQGVLAFLKRDPRLTDFSYWNNVDPPRGMRTGAGYRRWQARGRTWDRIDQNIGKHLVLHICDFTKFWTVTPFFDLCREHRQKVRTSSAEPVAGAVPVSPTQPA